MKDFAKFLRVLTGSRGWLQVSLYAFDSRKYNAVTHWIGEELESENPQSSGIIGGLGALSLSSPETLNQSGQSQGQSGLSEGTIVRAAYCIFGVRKCKEGTTCKPLAVEIADILVGVVLNGGVGICNKA